MIIILVCTLIVAVGYVSVWRLAETSYGWLAEFVPYLKWATIVLAAVFALLLVIKVIKIIFKH